MARWANETKWDAVINDVAEHYGVPSDLVRAIIATESQFIPSAVRQEAKDASAGLMQILLGTARGEGYDGALGAPGALSGLFDPVTNLTYGTSYLAHQYHTAGGSIPRTASAYNGGYRPDLGFGSPATHAMTICLQKDTTGKCVKTRSVKQGEFSNQPYVDAVLANMDYFQKKRAPILSGETFSPLTEPIQRTTDQPQAGGPAGGVTARVVGVTVPPKKDPAVIHTLAVASGKKWVSIAGLILIGFGALCADQREQLRAVLPWTDAFCSVVTFLGGIVASLGKGLVDRRATRPDHFGINALPKE
jgi:hypothetical protein